MQAISVRCPYLDHMDKPVKPPLLRCRPARLVATLVPAAIVAQVLIDALMGSSAEYFNAAHLLQAMGGFLVDGGLDDGPRFMLGQEHLSDLAALGLGTVLLLVVPTFVLAAVIFPISSVMRRKGATPCD